MATLEESRCLRQVCLRDSALPTRDSTHRLATLDCHLGHLGLKRNTPFGHSPSPFLAGALTSASLLLWFGTQNFGFVGFCLHLFSSSSSHAARIAAHPWNLYGCSLH